MKTFLIIASLALAGVIGCKDLSIFPDGGKGGKDGENPDKTLAIKDISGITYRLESWQSFSMNGASLIMPVPNGQHYSIRFDASNTTLQGTADCNVMRGAYMGSAPLKKISIVAAIVTDAICNANSMAAQYINSLNHAVRYEIKDKSLKIYWQPEVHIPEDTMWVMNFVQAEAPDNGSTCNIIPSFAPFSLIDVPPGAPFTCPTPPVIENDVLMLDVSYSGGCRKHTFSGIFDMDAFDKPGMPTVGNIPLMLLHHDDGDDCKAVITEKLRICLGDLRKELYNRYLISSSSTNTVLIKVAEHEVPFRFR